MPQKDDNKEQALPRPPVVVIVGHVDHGKTTLLDFIREASVAEEEAGKMTQAIGAYEVEHGDKKITFIDTPGHEAFSMMRSRGAAVADMAVLVVAANEGVKPQTTEAIGVLEKSKIPFVVAITKIDDTNSDVEKVKKELVTAGVALEGNGGDVSWHGVSGKTGEGVNDLLALITLVADVEQLTFNPSAHANGFILEAAKDNRRGIVANVILKNGILKRGHVIVTSTVSGKVKILEDFLGKPVRELLPSAPATVGGFESLPKIGEEFWADAVNIEVVGVVGGETSAQLMQAAETLARIRTDEGKKEADVNTILKAHTAGSLEALKNVLTSLVKIKDASVGDISDSDVKFAKSTGSIIVGFQVRVGSAAKKLADAQGVKIIKSDIIYRIVEAVESIDTTKEEKVTGGTLEVLATFSSAAGKQTIGGKVTEGTMRVNTLVEIIRGEEIVGKGRIKNLQQNKEDIKEVVAGNECGLSIATDIKIEKGDLLKT